LGRPAGWPRVFPEPAMARLHRASSRPTARHCVAGGDSSRGPAAVARAVAFQWHVARAVGAGAPAPTGRRRVSLVSLSCLRRNRRPPITSPAGGASTPTSM